MDIDFVLSCSQFIPSPHCGLSESLNCSDTNVVQDLCHLSHRIQSNWANYLIHQMLPFIFITHIIVIKRPFDDKNALILFCVSFIAVLVLISEW